MTAMEERRAFSVIDLSCVFLAILVSPHLIKVFVSRQDERKNHLVTLKFQDDGSTFKQ